MCRHTVYIVQDHESGQFLYPHDGSVGFTPLVRDAGYFYDQEEAVLTAVDHVDGSFTVLEILTSDKRYD
jgi:hypothetical protein